MRLLVLWTLALSIAACGESVGPKNVAGACGTPAAPTELRASQGPGPAQASIAWAAADANGGAVVNRYAVYRDGEKFARLGNTLAFGDTGSDGSHSYQVAAINTCGAEGPQSESVTSGPLPGTLVVAPVEATTAAKAELFTYKVLDASGAQIGTRTWRAVTGLGNCCETYVATDAAGRLYEYGGTTLYVSSDEGEIWRAVSNVAPALSAEGAIVGAPGGDMLAVNWDPYSGDQLWSHKYVAATDTWYTARTPLHQPFYDRPWVAVVEGPFEIEGQIIPYVSFVMSNYVHGDILMMSLDGLHYAVPNTGVVANGAAPLPLQLPPDPDRDWTQSIQATSIYPWDNGFGLRDRALLEGCPRAAAITPDMSWRCANWVDVLLAPERGEVVRIDSVGAIHVTTVARGADVIKHRVSMDSGRSWREVNAKVPGGKLVEDWDVQVNAALDQVVVVVHASEKADDTMPDQDMVFRFTDIHRGIKLKEILLVGDGDHVFGSSLASETDRFDYTTVALLASGHVALSFGDKLHVPPAVAIEGPGQSE